MELRGLGKICGRHFVLYVCGLYFLFLCYLASRGYVRSRCIRWKGLLIMYLFFFSLLPLGKSALLFSL